MGSYYSKENESLPVFERGRRIAKCAKILFVNHIAPADNDDYKMNYRTYYFIPL